MEQSPPLITEKIGNVVRIFFFLIQKGISKSKFLLDVHLITKRGKVIGKALNDVMLERHNALTCIPHDVHMSFVSPSPREYEFSCSGSPAYPPYKRSRTHYNYLRKHHRQYYKHIRYHPPKDDHCVASDSGGDAATASPVVSLGFGWSPLVRQVRITDSPFTLGDGDEDCHVDKEADKFIERFRKELRLQKWMAAGDHSG